MLGRTNSIDETTEPQVLLQVSTIHLIKEKNYKQSYFCKTMSQALKTELDLLKIINTIHLYIICTRTEKGYLSFHILFHRGTCLLI